MTKEKALKMAKAKLECMERETYGCAIDCNSDYCMNCALNYEQGNMGEQIEYIKMFIEILEQQINEGVKK